MCRSPRLLPRDTFPVMYTPSSSRGVALGEAVAFLRALKAGERVAVHHGGHAFSKRFCRML